MKKNYEVLPWLTLRSIERELVGRTIEIKERLNDDTFPGKNNFIRAKLERISWRDGRPAEVFFSDAQRCTDRPRRTSWHPYNHKSFVCNIRCFYPPIKDKDNPIREHAWKEAGGSVYVFASLDDDRIAIFTSDEELPSKPYFYRTVVQEVEEYKFLVKAAFG